MKSIIFVVLLLTVCAGSLAANKGLVVHEWGTFTAFQDEQGKAIGGINSDDEPVPAFVHRLRYDLILGTPSQGAPQSHPDVTMRLETPVAYFHRAPGDNSPLEVQMSAQFNGGWISEFFPAAKLEVDGKDVTNAKFDISRIKPETSSRVTWNLTLGGEQAAIADTNEHVWTAPRDVDASNVTAKTDKGSETEKYVFYRGVGHMDAQIKVLQKDGGLEVQALGNPLSMMPMPEVHKVWVAWIHDDGSCVAKEVALPETLGPGTWVSETDQRRGQAPMNLSQLQETLKKSLIAEGLFADEAEAMLKTWELSYFKSPGTRVFYIVPRGWTEQVLPLRVTEASEIVRVMVGRVEVATPQQREKVRALARGGMDAKEMQALYQRLGRFRNALILDEQRRNPNPALASFIVTRNLRGFSLFAK